MEVETRIGFGVVGGSGMSVPSSNVQLLTTGSIWKGLMSLAGPMFISTTLQNLQSVIGLFWVGRLGSDSVAALAMSGTILMMLFPVVMGLATGTVAVVSRSMGAGLPAEAAEAGGQSLVVSLMCGIVAGLAGWYWAGDICRLQGATGEVARLGTQYLGISFLGCFTVFLMFIGNSILQASGNTVIPMYAMVLTTALNLILDPVFIFGLLGMPRMGVEGAALAMVLAQMVGVVIVLNALAQGKSGVRVGITAWKFRLEPAWRLMKIGIPSSGQMLSRSLMSVALMRIVAGCGTAAVAAYGIGVRFHMMAMMPAFVLGNAAGAIVGQNLGAQRPDRAQRVAWLATGLGAVILLVSAVVLTVFAAPLIRVFDVNPEVVRIGRDYLWIASFPHVFVSLSIILGRALQGAGDTVAPMVRTIIGLWGLQVPLAIIMARHVVPATHGIWWSIAITLIANGVMVGGWFLTGRWKHKKV
jgi:putative MATE family efflux protein